MRCYFAPSGSHSSKLVHSRKSTIAAEKKTNKVCKTLTLEPAQSVVKFEGEHIFSNTSPAGSPEGSKVLYHQVPIPEVG